MLPPLVFVWSYSIVIVEMLFTSALAGSMSTRIGIRSSSPQPLRGPPLQVALPFDWPWRVAKLAAKAGDASRRLKANADRSAVTRRVAPRNLNGRRGSREMLKGSVPFDFFEPRL